MTRWAVVGPTYPYRGGIAHFSTLLVQHLRQGHEVAFYSFRRQYPSWLFPGRSDRDPSQSPLQTPVEYVLDPLNPLTWLQTFARIRRFRPDCLILFWWVPFWGPAWWVLAGLCRTFARIPVSYICHNVLPHEATLGSRWLARHVLSQSDYLIVLSREQGEVLAELLPGRVSVYAPHPTYGPLNRHPLGQTEARSLLDLPLEGPVLLFFGLVRPYKGLSVLLQAMPDVSQATGAKLLIVGEFWEPRERYEAQIADLGLQDAVRIVDQYVPDEDLPVYFGAADVVVLPYIHATQSGAAQLAFGFERPVIATNVGDFPDHVVDGETGWLVPPNNSAALTQAILRLFSEDVGPRFQTNISRQPPDNSWERFVEILEKAVQQK